MADDTSTTTSQADSSETLVTSGIPGSYPMPSGIVEQYKGGESFCYPDYPPCHTGDMGILYDFNVGVRVQVPDNGYKYRVVIADRDSGVCLHDNVVAPGMCISCRKKFFINYGIKVFDEDSHKEVWSHDFDARDKEVLLQLPYAGAVGDSIAWFSYIERFQQKTGCRAHVTMPPHMRALVEKQYPDITFNTLEEAKKLRPYAAYYLGLYFKGDENWQPCDFRVLSLSEAIGRILGVEDLSDIPPRVDLSAPRTIMEPYVCIATQASSHAKHWCNPSGWRELVEWLKSAGYRVLCIDKEKEVGVDDVWHHIPYGCEDFTGERPLQERINLIKDAAFFVGLSSGLSWVAWCCKVPVVLISGICQPFGEFRTPYHVQTRLACHGCWNDTRYEFDHHDFMWCPRFKGTKRAYECTKMITSKMVIDTIKRIPGVLPAPKEETEEKLDG